MNYGWLLFSFHGRISRAVFWNFLLIAILVLLVPASYIAIVNPGGADEYLLVAAVLLFWPSLAIQAKRWHDLDRSAWWVLLGFVPVIGQLWVLIDNGFLPGTAGSNRFGKNPLQRTRVFASEKNIPANL